MKKSILLLFVLPLLLGSCAPKIISRITAPQPPVGYQENIRIYDLHEAAPKQATVIGTVRITDSGFSTNCGLDVVIEKARTEARKAGGNAIKITEHRKPDLASTCHRITATILKLDPEQQDITDTEVIAKKDEYYAPPVVTKQDNNYYESVLPKWRFGVNGGWSSRLAKTHDDLPPVMKQFINEMKSGYNFGGDATYYFSDQLGAGLKLNNYFSSNQEEVQVTYPNGGSAAGTMSDQVNIFFAGPFISSRYWDLSGKNNLHMGLGIGYLGYTEQFDFIGDKFTLKGGTAGICWDLGYDLGLGNKNSNALAFQLSLQTGTLTQVSKYTGNNKEVIKLPEGSYESLTRIDLTIGLRFNK